MTIKTKLISAYSIIIILVLMLLGMEYISMKREAYKIQRLSWMHQEYTQLIALNLNLLKQMKDASDYMILGEVHGAMELEKSTFDVAISFNNIKNVIGYEKSFLEEYHEKTHEKNEENEYEEIWRKYNALNNDISRVVVMSKTDKPKALAFLSDTLENRFDHELLPMIHKWVGAEENDLFEMATDFVDSVERQRLVISFFSILILVVVFILSLSVNYLIANRLKDLMAKTHEVAKGDINTEISASGDDEITHLANSFNYMVKQLSESQNKLLEQSYHSGMAEMASGMLHNLKNVFAPLIVRLDALKIALNKINIDKFTVAVDDLTKNECPAERKAKLEEYVHLSLLNFKRTLDEIDGNIRSMSERTTTIERILDGQNQFAFAERPMEKISLAELIDDALMLIKKMLAEGITIDIDSKVSSIGPFKSHRIVLLQIIANIIMNALESIIRSETRHGLIAISAELEDKDGRKMIHLKVVDNGIGIEADKLEFIFQRGFSSKRKISSGLGLHWCANSITALKGRMYAESQGLNKGARIHLLIPFNQNQDK